MSTKNSKLKALTLIHIDSATALAVFSFLSMAGLLGVWISEATGNANIIVAMGLLAPSVLFFFAVTILFAVQSREGSRPVREESQRSSL